MPAGRPRKLTDSDIEQIRWAWRSRVTRATLASKYRVSVGYISKVIYHHIERKPVKPGISEEEFQRLASIVEQPKTSTNGVL